MINKLKNISGGVLDYTEGLTQPDQDMMTVGCLSDIYSDSRFEKLMEFLALGLIEPHAFNGDILSTDEARESLILKKVRLSTGVYPLIHDLIRPDMLNYKEVWEIQYDDELLPGVRLHGVKTIGAIGSLDNVEYYLNYVDKDNKGVKILQVPHTWTFDESQSIPAARKVQNRYKKWDWYNTDGVVTVTKDKPLKPYDTIDTIKNEGLKRRSNILAQAQYGVIVCMIYTGAFASQESAEEELTVLFGGLSNEFSTWRESGKGPVYDSLLNDTEFVWLDNIVNPTVMSILGLDSSWSTKTVRDYVIDKIKGLI